MQSAAAPGPLILVVEDSEAHELGANAFLTKPVDLDRLVEMIRALRDFFLCCGHTSIGQPGQSSLKPAGIKTGPV